MEPAIQVNSASSPLWAEMSTVKGAVTVLCGRENNWRSGVATDVCHTLWMFTTGPSVASQDEATINDAQQM